MATFFIVSPNFIYFFVFYVPSLLMVVGLLLAVAASISGAGFPSAAAAAQLGLP